MFINFTHKGKPYKLPLLLHPKISAYNCLAVVQLAGDTRPRLQLTCVGAANAKVKVKHLNILSSDFVEDVGRVRLSRSAKRAWLDNGYCTALKQFTITEV